jgi:lipoprotein-releasing system ATP-binding protein
MNKVLSLRRLVRDYALGNGRVLNVLKDVDLDLEAGEIVGLIGPSGSGKSSLLHAVGLLEPAADASIIIDNIDYNTATEPQRTRGRLEKIGFVYQFHHLLPEYTALGNVAIPQKILGKNNTVIDARARELLENLGLKDRIDHLPAQLSGGEQQRVAIARALANRPKLLLADEPTGNLDPNTSMHVFNALKTIVRNEGVGAIIATHNLDLARHMDRVLRLRDGYIEAVAL